MKFIQKWLHPDSAEAGGATTQDENQDPVESKQPESLEDAGFTPEQSAFVENLIQSSVERIAQSFGEEVKTLKEEKETLNQSLLARMDDEERQQTEAQMRDAELQQRLQELEHEKSLRVATDALLEAGLTFKGKLPAEVLEMVASPDPNTTGAKVKMLKEWVDTVTNDKVKQRLGESTRNPEKGGNVPQDFGYAKQIEQAREEGDQLREIALRLKAAQEQ